MKAVDLLEAIGQNSYEGQVDGETGNKYLTCIICGNDKAFTYASSIHMNTCPIGIIINALTKVGD